MFHFDLDDTLSLLKVFNFWATPPREGVPLVGEAKPLVEIFTTMVHKHEGWDEGSLRVRHHQSMRWGSGVHFSPPQCISFSCLMDDDSPLMNSTAHVHQQQCKELILTGS